MSQPTPTPQVANDTLPDLGSRTQTAVPAGLLPGPAPRPPAPSWGRAWRSCWPMALGIALVVGGLLALLADFQQPHDYERVVAVHIAPPANDPQLNLPAQLHQLRALAEPVGVAVVEGPTPGGVELRKQGRDPAALEQPVAAVVARHRQEMAARQEPTRQHRAAELARVEERLKDLPAAGPDQTNTRARAALQQAEQHRAALEQELADFHQNAAFTLPPVPPDVVERLLRGDPRGFALVQERARLLADMEQIRRVANPSKVESFLRRYRLRLSEVEGQIADLQVRVTEPLRVQSRANWEAERRARRASLTEQIATARTTEQAARAHLEALLASPTGPDPRALAERTRLEEQRRQLAEEVRRLGEGVVAPGGFEVQAETTREVGLLLRYGGVLAAGLLGGLGFGALVVSRQRAYGKVRSAVELAETTGLPVLGRLPVVGGNAVPIPGVRPAGSTGQEVAALEAATDVLRAPVLRQLHPGPVRLLVTSAGPGDGRTTVATQLACSLARAGKRVLLVDGSPGRAELAWLFQLAPEPGLAEVLRGELDLAGVVQATSFSRLWLLPAGHTDPQSQAALVQDWSAHLFEPILGQLDVVIIDGPALDAGPEAAAWAARCQAVLLAVRADHTPLSATHAACQGLHLMQAPVLGLVFLETAASRERLAG